MKRNNILFGIVTASNDYDKVLKINLKIYKKIYKEFGNFYILNLSNLLLLNKTYEAIEKKFFFSKNIKVFKPKSKKELIDFFKNKKFIAFNNLGKSLSYFKIFYYLKKINIRLILLMNYGHISNTVNFQRNITKKFSSIIRGNIYYIRTKFINYLFRIFTILNIFPQIDLYFESSQDIYSSIKKGIKVRKKIEKYLPLLKFSYFRNIFKINSRSFDFYKKNKKLKSKYICFVDSGIDNLDVALREGKISIINKKKYYSYLKTLFIHLNKIFKKKVIICLHPKNNDKYIYKIFKNYKITKYNTPEIIKNSFLVLFHDSSAALDSILLKKNMLCLKSEILGIYWSDRVNQYAKELGLPSIVLGNKYLINKTDLLKQFSISKIKQKKYTLKNLNIDKNKIGEDKVVGIIKKIFLKKEKSPT